MNRPAGEYDSLVEAIRREDSKPLLESDVLKLPLAGEWWTNCYHEPAFIVGVDNEGDPVYLLSAESNPCRDYLSEFLLEYKIEPRCTGFDWTRTPDPVQTVIDQGEGYRCTEAEALARIKPVESPDDWVTQDRVPARPGIDQRAYRSPVNDDLFWQDSKCIEWSKAALHGAEINGDTLLLRCRRKDLPRKQEQLSVKRVPVRLWTHKNIVKGSPCRVFAQTKPPATDCNAEVFSDGNEGWEVRVTE